MAHPLSDHCDGAHFFNPEPPLRVAGRRRYAALRLLAARLRRDEKLWARWPQWIKNKPYPPPEGEHSIVWVGHSCFLLRLAGLTILTDPVFSKRCSPVRFAGPSRVRAPGVEIGDLPRIDLVLLSHNHYDHMDIGSLRALRRHSPGMRIVTPLGNAAYLARRGIPGGIELDWWESVSVHGAHVTVTPARHFSSRTLRDGNETLWGGLHLSHKNTRVFFAGDTGYTRYFAEIRRRLGAPDLAMLPIGAYEPRWMMGTVHMNPGDAVQAFLDLGAARAVGMHFGTFQLTAEPIDAPPRVLGEALDAAGVARDRFFTLDIGESAPLLPAPVLADA